jgi:hypothetical protein
VTLAEAVRSRRPFRRPSWRDDEDAIAIGEGEDCIVVTRRLGTTQHRPIGRLCYAEELLAEDYELSDHPCAAASLGCCAL